MLHPTICLWWAWICPYHGGTPFWCRLDAFAAILEQLPFWSQIRQDGPGVLDFVFGSLFSYITKRRTSIRMSLLCCVRIIMDGFVVSMLHPKMVHRKGLVTLRWQPVFELVAAICHRHIAFEFFESLS